MSELKKFEGKQPQPQERSWTEWMLMVVLATVPLFMNVHSATQFEPDKAALFQWLMLMSLVPLVARAMRRFRLGWGFWHRMPRVLQTIIVMTGLWLTSMGISWWLALSPATAWWGAYSRGTGVLTTIILVVFAGLMARYSIRSEIRDRFMMVLHVGSVPIALFSIFQRFGWDPVSWGTQIMGRTWSTLGNPIFLGAFMALMVPMSAAMLIIPPGREQNASLWKAPFYLITLILQVVSALTAFSRGPLLALGIGLFAGSFLLPSLRCTSSVIQGGFFGWIRYACSNRYRWVLAGLLSGVAIFAFLAFCSGVFLPKPAAQGLNDQLNSGTAKVRQGIWEGVETLMRTNPTLGSARFHQDTHSVWRPWFGYGPECLAPAFSRVYSRVILELETTRRPVDMAHNGSMDTWVKGGLAGLLVFYAWIVALLLLLVTAVYGPLNRSTRHSALGWILTTGLLSALAGRLLSGHLYGSCIATIPGCIAGMILWVLKARRHPVCGGVDTRIASLPLRAGLSTVVVVHLLETSVGIVHMSTALVFWAVLAWLVAIVCGDHRGLALHVKQEEKASGVTSEDVRKVLVSNPEFTESSATPVPSSFEDVHRASLHGIGWGVITCTIVMTLTFDMLMIHWGDTSGQGVLPVLWLCALGVGWLALWRDIGPFSRDARRNAQIYFFALIISPTILHAAVLTAARCWHVNVRSVQDLATLLVPGTLACLIHLTAILLLPLAGLYFHHRVLPRNRNPLSLYQALRLGIAILVLVGFAAGSCLSTFWMGAVQRQGETMSAHQRFGLAARFFAMGADHATLVDHHWLMAAMSCQMQAINPAISPTQQGRMFAMGVWSARQSWNANPFRHEPPLVLGCLFLDRARPLHDPLMLSQAEKYFIAARDIAPTHPMSWTGLAQIRLLQKHSVDALRLIQECLSQTPGDASLFATGAEARLACHDPRGALEWYKKAYECDSRQFCSAFGFAQLQSFEGSGDLPSVMNLLSHWCAKDPKDLRLQWTYGQGLLVSGRPNEAIRVFRLSIQPNCAIDATTVRESLLRLASAGFSSDAETLATQWRKSQPPPSFQISGE